MNHPPIKTLIIDDEPAARRGIRMLLASDAEVQVVGEAGSVSEAVILIQQEKPELVFLDIQMPGGSGFDVLARLSPESRPVVVFITAFDEYAVKAFEVHALDYLLKPYEDSRFQEALLRAKDSVRSRDGKNPMSQIEALLSALRGVVPQTVVSEDASGGRILVKSSGDIILLKPDELDWVEAEGDYVKFHVAGRSHLMRETMAHLEERLDAKKFVRIHRSIIVNIDRVRKLTPTFSGEYSVILMDGTSLKMSRTYHERLQELLRQKL